MPSSWRALWSQERVEIQISGRWMTRSMLPETHLAYDIRPGQHQVDFFPRRTIVSLQGAPFIAHSSRKRLSVRHAKSACFEETSPRRNCRNCLVALISMIGHASGLCLCRETHLIIQNQQTEASCIKNTEASMRSFVRRRLLSPQVKNVERYSSYGRHRHVAESCCE